jgi:UDP-N-acetylglucosamine--N-acetylmuramyl-(pentapeptide) pyrophosphoryl-undecaprenol N-acetylglucosamine transferase
MLPPHVMSPRILFYAANGLGLGHVTRLLAIATAMREQSPFAQFLFLTTSEADNVIYSQGFASVKLPSRSALAKTGLRPRVFNKLTNTVVTNTIAAFNPAIMVVDTFPAGASQELLSTLNWEMRRAFVFRAQQPGRMADPFFQAALSAYDLCIIPHKEGSENLPVPGNVRQKWTGEIFIRSRDRALGKEQARAALGLPIEGKVMYVSFGGGGDEEISRALHVTLEAAKDLEWTIAVADAPLQALKALDISGQNIVRIRHYPMAECFNAFDAAVSAGGYNTVAELIHFGIPSIIIPFPRGLDDQFARADALSNSGAALRGDLQVERMRRQIDELVNEGNAKAISERAKELIPGNGASSAAEAILSLL